jgi:hypothetical protein
MAKGNCSAWLVRALQVLGIGILFDLKKLRFR